MSYEITKIRNVDGEVQLVPVTLKSRPYEDRVQENVINIQMFSDYSCPWCFLAEKFLESLKYEMRIEYIGIEQHPNVPVGGKEIEAGSCLKNTIRRINHRGQAFGAEIPDVKIGPNTHKALLLGEYAKMHEKQEAFSKAAMHAYFIDGKNISDEAVLDQLAAQLGIDDGWKNCTEELENALKENRRKADLYQIYSVPSFIINDAYLIRGMDDERVFEEVFERVM